MNENGALLLLDFLFLYALPMLYSVKEHTNISARLVARA